MSPRSRNQQKAESSLVFFRAPNIKVLFLPCYKNASSSLLVWLAGLEQRASSGDALLKLGAEISRRGAEACLVRDRIGCLNLEDYLRHHSDYFVFGISRNPYSRIVSAYRDKINRLVKRAMPDVYVRAVACQILEGPSSWSNNKSAIRHMRRMISFGDFLQKLALEGLGIDDHYQLQAVLMRPDLLPSAQFYKLEYLRETLIPAMAAHLSRHGYGSEISPELMPTQNAMGGSFDYRDFYGNGLMSLVEDLYAPDFQPFGYKKGSL